MKILLRLARIQSSFLVYEVSILRADSEQVEVHPAVAPHALKKMIKLLFSCRELYKTPQNQENQQMKHLNHHVDAFQANHYIMHLSKVKKGN